MPIAQLSEAPTSISIPNSDTVPDSPRGTISTATPAETDSHSDERSESDALAEDAPQQDDEQWDDGDDQCRQTARDIALAEHDEAVATEKQCQADETRTQPFGARQAQRTHAASSRAAERTGSAPAVRWRTPAVSSGGIVSTTTLMAR